MTEDLEKAIIEGIYLRGKDKIRNNKLKKVIQNRYLDKELVRWSTLLKTTVKEHLTEEQWAVIQDHRLSVFVAQLLSNIKKNIWTFDAKTHKEIYFIVNRILSVEGFEEEIGLSKQDLESYYVLFDQTLEVESKSSQMCMGFMKITKESYECMDRLIAEYKAQESIEQLVIRISKEISAIIENNVKHMKTEKPAQPLTLLEMKEGVKRFQELQVCMQSENLRTYISNR